MYVENRLQDYSTNLNSIKFTLIRLIPIMHFGYIIPCPLDSLQLVSPGFGTHSTLAVQIAVISGPESHLKVASDPSITSVKSTNPLLGLGGTPQVAERDIQYFNDDMSLHTMMAHTCTLTRQSASCISWVWSPFPILHTHSCYHSNRYESCITLVGSNGSFNCSSVAHGSIDNDGYSTVSWTGEMATCS